MCDVCARCCSLLQSWGLLVWSLRGVLGSMEAAGDWDRVGVLGEGGRAGVSLSALDGEQHRAQRGWPEQTQEATGAHTGVWVGSFTSLF